jgi:hypothetical protein
MICADEVPDEHYGVSDEAAAGPSAMGRATTQSTC